MKLVRQHEEWDYIENTYEHNGYTIEETYCNEDDCYHHQARVLKDNKELLTFYGNGCLEQAKKYIDSLGEK